MSGNNIEDKLIKHKDILINKAKKLELKEPILFDAIHSANYRGVKWDYCFILLVEIQMLVHHFLIIYLNFNNIKPSKLESFFKVCKQMC